MPLRLEQETQTRIRALSSVDHVTASSPLQLHSSSSLASLAALFLACLASSSTYFSPSSSLLLTRFSQCTGMLRVQGFRGWKKKQREHRLPLDPNSSTLLGTSVHHFSGSPRGLFVFLQLKLLLHFFVLFVVLYLLHFHVSLSG